MKTIILLAALVVILFCSCNSSNEPLGKTPGIYLTVVNASDNSPLANTSIYATDLIKIPPGINDSLAVCPNPFFTTTVQFHLMSETKVTATVHEQNGNVIDTFINQTLRKGTHGFLLNTDSNSFWRKLASGFYLMKVDIGGRVRERVIYFGDYFNMSNIPGLPRINTDGQGKAFIGWDKFPFFATGRNFIQTNEMGAVIQNSLITDSVTIVAKNGFFNADSGLVHYQKDRAVELTIKLSKK